VGGTGAIGTNQQLLAMPSRDLGDRLAEDLDVVGSGVGAGVAGPQLDREHLGGVVAPHAERVEAERLLERRGSLVLLAVRGDQGGVDVEHDHLAEVALGDLRGRHPAGQLLELSPDVAADLRPRRRDPFHRGRGQLVQRPPHRRRRCHRSQHAGLVPQHVDVGDRLTTVSEHHRDIDQHPATVVDRSERPTPQGLGQLTGEPDPIGQHPVRHGARVRHDTAAVASN